MQELFSRTDVAARKMHERTTRERSASSVTETAGRSLVAELDLHGRLERWHEQLARYRALAMSGRKADQDLNALLIDMRNTKHRLATEMQARGQGISKSGAVSSLLRSLDRAIEDARSLRGR